MILEFWFGSFEGATTLFALELVCVRKSCLIFHRIMLKFCRFSSCDLKMGMCFWILIPTFFLHILLHSFQIKWIFFLWCEDVRMILDSAMFDRATTLSLRISISAVCVHKSSYNPEKNHFQLGKFSPAELKICIWFLYFYLALFHRGTALLYLEFMSAKLISAVQYEVLEECYEGFPYFWHDSDIGWHSAFGQLLLF